MEKVSPANKLKHKLLSGGLWAFAGKFSTSFLSLVINAVLARYLLPNDLGVYFLAFNLALAGAYLGTMGLEQTSLKFIADYMGRKKYADIHFIVKFVYLTAAAGALIVGILYFLSSTIFFKSAFHSAGLDTLTAVIVAWIVVNIFQVLLSETFRGFQDIRFASIFGGLFSTALFIIGFCTISVLDLLEPSSKSIIQIWVGSIFLSNGVGSLILLNKAFSIKRKVKPGEQASIKPRKILSTSFPFLIVAVSLALLNQADLWLVKMVATDEDVAIYGTAAKLTILIGIPILIVNAVVSPIIAEKFAQGQLKNIEKLLRTVSALATYPSMILVILFLLLGGPILSILFGSFYSSGAIILILLSIKQLTAVWNGVCGTILSMTGYEKTFMRIIVTTGIVSVIVSYILGIFYKGNGIALGMMITNAISQIYLFFKVRKVLHIRADADLIGTLFLIKGLLQKKNPKKRAIS